MALSQLARLLSGTQGFLPNKLQTVARVFTVVFLIGNKSGLFPLRPELKLCIPEREHDAL
jgi:hypothetical protein